MDSRIDLAPSTRNPDEPTRHHAHSLSRRVVDRLVARAGSPLGAAIAVALLASLWPSQSDATLRAYYRVNSLNSGCWVDDQDPWPTGDPERYWRMGVFDSSSTSIFNACASGCSDDGNPSTWDGRTSDYCSWNTGCGNWNFTDRTISKVIPNGRGAYFYFGLFDEDNNADDSLGDHWFWASSPTSGTSSNNNLSPYYADYPISSVCGRDVVGIGDDGNFSVTYSVWFDDNTYPSAPSTINQYDDGYNNSGWDNDSRLDFNWTSASDSESGISQYRISLWDSTIGQYIFYNQSTGTSRSRSVCSSGCNISYNPVHNHDYLWRVSATNGSYPTIQTQRTSNTSWHSFSVDRSNPSTSITSNSSWHNSTFTVDVNNSDSGSGLGSGSCEWRVLSNGSQTRSWANHTCNGNVYPSVGSSLNCRHQGAGACTVQARATDIARRSSGTASRTFNIDWSDDSIASLTARTSQSGSTIPSGGWTQDRDPYFSWTIGSTISPIASYHWRMNADPGSNCATGTSTGGGNSGSAQLSSNTLSEGSHTFYVRPRDSAGNCGNLATRVVRVDYTGDNMSNLRAENTAGQSIFEGVFQQDTTPRLRWNPSSSTAPIAGYSYSTSGTPDCSADAVEGNSVLVGPLSQGVTTFRIRPIDVAGNCGNVDSFDVAVDSVADPVTNVRAFTEAGGDPIQPDTPQSDNDPLLMWDPVTSVSDVDGYSFVFSAGSDQPDCSVDVVSNSVGAPSLPDGITYFRVRARDEAGNCGPVSEFPINVDTQGVEILSLSAFNDSTKTTGIANLVWQRDIDPYVEWVPEDPGPTAAQIVGYRFSVDASLPCDPSTLHIDDPTETSWVLSGLGQGVTRFRVMAVDAADNCGPVASFDIAVDTVADPIIGLTANNSVDGAPIGDGQWQQDNRPVLSWQANPTNPETSPIVGYAWSTSGVPTCDEVDTEREVQLPLLGDGETTFSVRARDAAGNCGTPSNYVLAVDTTGDDPVGLLAFTQPGGSVISNGVWQQDNTPYLTWSSPIGPTSPIAGYNWGIDGDPLDCEVRVAAPGVSLDLLDGETTFSVLAVDEAGNCGDEIAMVLAIDTAGEAITGLSAYADSSETVSILPNTWQRDATPWITWEPPAGSTSPIVGYDTTLDGQFDCAVDRGAPGTGAALDQGTTRISVMAVDDAGNCGPPSHLDLLLDSETDGVSGLAAYTEAGGAAVPARTWVNDNSLYLEWNDSASTSPIAGYSWTTEPVTPDCEIDETTSATTLPVLADGSTFIRVRAIDQAGNCGDAASIELWIDTEANVMSGISAETVPGGEPIGSGAWQQDNAPLLKWTADAGSESDIAGYNWSISGDLECGVIDTTSTQVRLINLPDGITTFQIVAIDEAGNCDVSLAGSFDVAVDTTPDEIIGLSALTGAPPDPSDPVPFDTWQNATDQPLFLWTADPDTDAPIGGFSWRAIGTGSGGTLDCIVDTTDTQVTPAVLPQGRSTFEVRSIDSADNCGPVASWIVAVDTEGDVVNNLRTEATPGGAPIGDGVWQTDATPRVRWDVSSSTSPDAGYSWSTEGPPDCSIDTPALLTELLLDDGVTTMQVRVIDTAGNCADEVASIDIAVDTVDDSVANLRALTEAGGTPIGDGVVQQDPDPLLLWDPGVATAPVAGYSYSIENPGGIVNPGGPADDPIPDCTVDLTTTELALGPLPEDTTSFRVRQIDEAGNCGLVEQFDIVVDTQSDVIAGLRAEADDGSPIQHSTWQTATSVTLSWDASFPPSPDAGYSYSLGDGGATLDCTVDTEGTEVAYGTLADGIHHFRVRAIDAAGNCGAEAAFTIAIDTTGDDLATLEALHIDTGATIASGSWHTDPAPRMRWTVAEPPADAAPIEGYAWRLDADPPCTAEVMGTEVDLSGLDDTTTEFAIVARDTAGNCGAIERFSLAVDTLADDLDALDVYDAEGGAPLSDGVWQPDTDPFVTWSAPSSVSPIVGYSIGVGAAPDCTVQQAAPGVSLGPDDGLDEGRTTVSVAAIDAAGNCGAPATFELAIDSQPDGVDRISAAAVPSGELIGDGVWQQNDTPLMSWVAEDSPNAGIAGFNWSIDGDLDCGVVDTTANEVNLSDLPDGITTFEVVVIDEAGNCDPALAASFDVAVDSTPDAVVDLQALTGEGGDVVPHDTWQNVTGQPIFVWTPDPSTHAPITGYSWRTLATGTVGPDLDCEADTTNTLAIPGPLGQGRTSFEVRALDSAGNCGPVETWIVAVDTEAEDVPGLRAESTPGGEAIGDGVWQTDPTPRALWDATGSVAPDAGYSWSVESTPDCVVDTTEQLLDLDLDDGVTTFHVRAVDAAGNCSDDDASMDLAVDTVDDQLTNLRALTEEAGSPIGDGIVQPDADPLLLWTPGAATAPIAGYSYAIDGPDGIINPGGPADDPVPDCTADTPLTDLAIGPLAEGTNTFRVRQVDEAGNCGVVETFVIEVDSQADIVAGLRAEADDGTPIAHSTWQTETSVTLSWDPSFSPAAGAGYSYALNGAEALDCDVDTSATEVAYGSLDDGVHVFDVRAIDAAGNCGDIAQFVVNVDTLGNDLLTLEAIHADTGDGIADGLWQTDDAPRMRWTIDAPPANSAPIAGFAWRLDEDPPCEAETTASEVDLMLEDAATEFAIVARDLAGNCGAISRFTLAVDTQPDAIATLEAYDVEGGRALTSGVWQTDTDPFVTWEAPTSVSPILGYSVGVGEPPSCSLDQTVPGVTLGPDDGIVEGRTLVAVSAIDSAGNCGDPATFEIAVDSAGEAIVGLTALTEPGGSVVPSDVWQRDDSLVMVWDAAASTSEIVGYAYTTSPDALDCSDTADTLEIALPDLPEGVTTFRLRALDEAGNCGPAATYLLAVDTQPDTIGNLQALTAPDGASIPRGEWQQDADPLFVWNPPGAPTSPIIGYSWSLDPLATPLDETVDTATHEAAVTLDDGEAWFRVRAIDAAGNPGVVASFLIKVDQTPDDVAELRVLSEAGGTAYTEGVWVADDTVVLDWAAPTTAAPLDGYSWGQGTAGNCIINIDDSDLTEANPAALPDGITTFWVRAIDEAGNCGASATFELSVDTTGDPVTDLTVFTDEGGRAIANSAWQQDNDPYLTWSDPPSDAPIVGYAVGLDSVPTCVSATEPATSFTYDEDDIPDGQYELVVVSRDQAGNCAASSPFELWVLAAAPELVLEPITPNPARAGVDLMIRVSVDRELAEDPVVTVGDDGEALFVGTTSGIHRYVYTVQGDEPEGLQQVRASGTDLAGNSGTAAAEVEFDFTPPGLVDGVTITPGVVTTGDAVAIELEADETLAGVPDLLIAGDNEAAFVESTENTYVFDYAMTGAEGEGPVELSVLLEDLAGNTAEELTTFVLDLTAPVVEVTEPDSRLVLDMGDELEIAWETTELHPATVDIWLSTDAGDTYDTLIAEGVEDTGSWVWTVEGDETNAARFRVVATDVVGLTGQDESPIDVRIREPVPDHVVAVAGGGPTTIGASAEVVLMVVDELGDPVDGVFQVSAEVDGSAVIPDTTLVGATPGETIVSGQTAEDGTARLEVFNLVAETVRVEPMSPELPAVLDHVGANVIFVAQTGDHLLVNVDDGVANVGETETLTVVTVDRAGNPTDADVEVRLAVDGNAVIASSNLRSAIGIGSNEVFGRLRVDGTASVQVTSNVTETVLVTAHSDSLPNERADEPAEVVFAQLSDVDPLQVTIEADPPRVYADDVTYSTITVTPRNSAGDIIGSGLDVDVFADAGRLEAVVDEGDGTYTTRIRSADCYDTPVPIGARVEDVLVEDGTEVTFTCDEIGGGALDAVPDGILADGETCSTITLTLENPSGRPMLFGQHVDFSVTYGEITDAQELEGFYRSTLCSNVCADDPIVVTATVNGVALTDVDPSLRLEVPVECLGVDPARSTIEADPRSAQADGQSASTITVTPIRLDEQPMGSGLEVVIDATLGDLTEVFDEGDGTYTAQLTSETIGESVVTAQVAGTWLEDDERVTFLDFTPPADWVTLDPQLVGLDPQDASLTLVTLNMRNESQRSLDSLTIRMSAPRGFEVDTTRTSFGDYPVVVSYDGGADQWAITIDNLPLPTDDEAMVALDLVLRRSSSAELSEGAALTFRAWWREDPVSRIAELTLGAALLVSDPPKGACGCSASDTPVEATPVLVALGLVVLGARRRRKRS